MTPRRITVLALFLLLAGGGTALAQKGVSLNLPWASDAKEAKKKATAEKKPIVVCFIQRTCKLSMYMIKDLHEDGRIYDLTDRFVWLCVDPTRKKDFKWFLSECGDAVEGTPTLFFLNEKGQYADPKLAGIDPVAGAEPSRIIRGLRAVLGRFKQDLPKERKEALAKKKEEAGASAASDPGQALKLLGDLIREAEGWASMEEAVQGARDSVEKILQAGMQKVREILAKKMAPAEALEALKKLASAHPGTPVSHWCESEIVRLEKAIRAGK